MSLPLQASLLTERGFARPALDPRLYGSFIEHLGRAVYGGVYDPAHPSADGEGFRRDVLDLVRELRVPVIRYPGGNYVSAYNWEDGVGPLASRPRRLDLAWKAVEPNLVGPAEFARWAGKAGADVMMALNLGTRGIEEARNFVEYCNHPGGTAWSDLRRSNGSPEPFGFKVFCLGNEMDGHWQVGYKTAEEYGKLACETAKALKLFDPALELVACGSSGPGMPTFPQWEATVLERCQEHVDYVSFHMYAEKTPAGRPEFLAQSLAFERSIRTAAAAIDFAKAKAKSRKAVKISVDEWNVWYRTRDAFVREPWGVAPPVLEEAYSMEDALVVGCMLISLMRCSDRVGMACLAQLVNAIAPIFAPADGPAFRQTIFYPFLHASSRGRGRLLEAALESPAYESRDAGPVPYADAAAVWDEERAEIAVFCVNRHESAPVEFRMRLGSFGRLEPLEHVALFHSDPDASNTAAAPQAVAPRTLAPPAAEGEYALARLPPFSWNMIRFAAPG